MSSYTKEQQHKIFQNLGMKQLSVQVTPEISPKINVWMTPNTKFLIKEEFGWRCTVYHVTPLTKEGWELMGYKQTDPFTRDGELEEFVKTKGTI